MKITLTHRAGEHERYARDAFDSQIGKTVPLNLGDQPIENCRVVAVEVAPDGKSAALTFELPPSLTLLELGVTPKGYVTAAMTYELPPPRAPLDDPPR